ncbi:G patch domain-containing protein [Lachnellula willkommii]|uniref:G patch domain-containing protein n=1 Tax=Lachnellula willkommii TaxID=215461 RepID=A0A559M8K7_9HELO|nr:G patch domain-containing protein [Lachnellula willkommii]
MPPRGFTNPAPKTDSAREAVKSFYCELCSKGYARMNEYEAHLSSYDHSHKQRLKDMRQLTRDPLASSKARKAEAKADKGMGLISIKLGGEGGVEGGEKTGGANGGGFKKGGFKKAGFKSAFAPASDGVETQPAAVKSDERGSSLDEGRIEGVRGGESDTEDEGYEMYDPRFPTE